MSEKVKKVKGALRIALLCVISLVLGFALYNWNAQSLMGNAMPMPFGVGVGVVMSGSMEPDLSVNDVIVVKAEKNYEVDDVVVFQQKNLLVVHKIISIEGETVTTQGTANNAPDVPIHIGEIKGVVVFHIDGLGKVVTWLKSPLGTVCILAIAGLMLAWSYSSENKEKEKEKDARAEKIDEIKREIEKLKGHEPTNGHCEEQRDEAIPTD